MDKKRQRYIESQRKDMIADHRCNLADEYQTESIVDTSQEQLRVIQQTRSHPDPKVLGELRKRKLLIMQKVISYEFDKGPKFAAEFVKEETDLTADMLAR